MKKQEKNKSPAIEGVVTVKVKKPSHLSVGRIILLCLIGAIMLGFFISALITCFKPELQVKFGGWLTKAARVIDPQFSKNLDGVYGKWLCFGYFGVISIGFLLLGTLLRYDRRKLSVLFYILFYVVAIASDVLMFYFCRGQSEIVANDTYANMPTVYRLLGFIPLPTVIFSFLLIFARAYVFVAMPIIAQILMIMATYRLKKFKSSFYETVNVLAFILLIGFTPVLISYIFFTVVAVIIVGTTLWAIKGFFTIDTGRFVQTSDGGTLYQVDGDLYSDGNGNYYTYDGESFR